MLKKELNELYDNGFINDDVIKELLKASKLGCKCIGGKYSINDFDKIEPFERNRLSGNEADYDEKDKKNIQDKIESMKQRGQLVPGVAKFENGKLKNMEGNHRMMGCKKMNKPYEFTISENYTPEDAIDSSKQTKGWDIVAFVKSMHNDNVPYGNLIYSIVKKYSDNQNVTQGSICNVVIGVLNKMNKNVMPSIDTLKRMNTDGRYEQLKNISIDNINKSTLEDSICYLIKTFEIDKFNLSFRNNNLKLNNNLSFNTAWVDFYINCKDMDRFIRNFTKVSKCSNDENRVLYGQLANASNKTLIRGALLNIAC